MVSVIEDGDEDFEQMVAERERMQNRPAADDGG